MNHTIVEYNLSSISMNREITTGMWPHSVEQRVMGAEDCRKTVSSRVSIAYTSVTLKGPTPDRQQTLTLSPWPKELVGLERVASRRVGLIVWLAWLNSHKQVVLYWKQEMEHWCMWYGYSRNKSNRWHHYSSWQRWSGIFLSRGVGGRQAKCILISVSPYSLPLWDCCVFWGVLTCLFDFCHLGSCYSTPPPMSMITV